MKTSETLAVQEGFCSERHQAIVVCLWRSYRWRGSVGLLKMEHGNPE